jgi:hypothetical protein
MGMGEQAAEPVEFSRCEPGSTEQVTYQRQELPGLAYDRPGGSWTGYLECPRGPVSLPARRVSEQGKPTPLQDMRVNDRY